jgi:hypothetical protein
MKYTIAIAALLGLIQANEIYDAPVNATQGFAEKKQMAKAESDEDDDDSDSSDVQADSSSSTKLQEDADSSSSTKLQEDADSSSSTKLQADSSSSTKLQDDADSSSSTKLQESDDDDDSSSSTKLQLEGDDESSDHSGEFFEAREHGTGPLDKKYERVVPSHFAEASDDLFMRSMIKTYALEGKNKDGSPNGQFFMDEATTRAAASEVLETHKGLKGGAKNDYLKTYFPRTWAHFDVNKTGKVGVEVMPQFMRFLASDQTLSL